MSGWFWIVAVLAGPAALVFAVWLAAKYLHPPRRKT